jgi:hypothetical protein
VEIGGCSPKLGTTLTTASILPYVQFELDHFNRCKRGQTLHFDFIFSRHPESALTLKDVASLKIAWVWSRKGLKLHSYVTLEICIVVLGRGGSMEQINSLAYLRAGHSSP